MTERWYVVQTKSNKELLAWAELNRQGFVSFVPQYRVTKVVRGKIEKVTRPLFPSYMFIKLDLTKDKWRSVGGTRGVICLVTGTENGATPLPRGFVEEMIESSDNEGYLSVREVEEIVQDYTPGTELRVGSGVFEGITGTCEGVQNGVVSLFIALLSGKVKLKLPLSLVAPLPEEGPRR